MTVIERCDHCEREFSETEDTFVSDTGSEICGWCAATWFGEERTRLSEQLRGAVEDVADLVNALADAASRFRRDGDVFGAEQAEAILKRFGGQ